MSGAGKGGTVNQTDGGPCSYNQVLDTVDAQNIAAVAGILVDINAIYALKVC